MKMLHLADLHIGKRVNEFSMLNDQRYILEQILTAVRAAKPQAALLAGDIYDKSTPAAEAVQLCDWFLTQLAAAVPAVLIIPGNHDSAERLAFAASLLQGQGVYIAKPFADTEQGQVQRVELHDEFGPVDFYLLPFLKPALVRRALDADADVDLSDYNRAVGLVMQQVQARLRPRPVRNVLLAHQLITGAAVCDSDELAIGGLDNVDVGWFAGFDYVALGHLHSPQRVQSQQDGQPLICYAGSPLKYSFSEARQQKSISLPEIDAAGQVRLNSLPLKPLHDLREIKGEFARLTAADWRHTQDCEDYLHITLTDELDVPDAVLRLRQFYPNLMKLDYDNRRTRSSQRLLLTAPTEQDPLKLFSDFYEQQNNQRLDDEQEQFLRQLIGEIWDKKQA